MVAVVLVCCPLLRRDIVPHGGAGQGQASDLDGLALARVGILKGAGGGDAQPVAAELAVQLYARVIKRRVGSLVIVFVLRRDAGDGDALFATVSVKDASALL